MSGATTKKSRSQRARDGGSPPPDARKIAIGRATEAASAEVRPEDPPRVDAAPRDETPPDRHVDPETGNATPAAMRRPAWEETGRNSLNRGGMVMDPKMVEINNLRVLNDYLNQTIDALARTSRLGGLSHTPYGVNPFVGMGSPFGVGYPESPYAANVMGGLSHSSVAPFGGFGFGTPFGTSSYGSFPGAIDPFFAQRGLSHTGIGSAWQPWSPISEVARTQQLAQAVAARQSVLEAMIRAAGIPV